MADYTWLHDVTAAFDPPTFGPRPLLGRSWRCSGGVFERGQEGLDGGEGLVGQYGERGSALFGYPSAGGGEQDGGEHEGDEFELVIVGGAAGAAGEQAGQEIDAPALLAGVTSLEGRDGPDEPHTGEG